MPTMRCNADWKWRPLRVSTDNRAVDNSYTEGKMRGSWNQYNGNFTSNNQHVHLCGNSDGFALAQGSDLIF